ncbi:angio-associated migratory cell protein-like [Xenia sp. Carnegie-2017]|uniref:angio-associated migratory cell protein-like n=1 Tax=Xenia sp. Carnegie-2017 TaxID=2897299 RepID=UPI001F0495AB|nr:angio-associated migratory cell protein-like [Xenia sp. Carnegie-2017]
MMEDDYGEHEEDDFQIVEEIELDYDEDCNELAYAVEDLGVDGELTENDDDLVIQRDDSGLTFTKHSESVFAVDFDPSSRSHIVSGGEDNRAFVWKISDGSVKFLCDGHKDSVTCVKFSHDSKYVATGDMSGLIKVWSFTTGVEIWSFETSDLEWLLWHHGAHVLFAGTADGEFWMWKIPDGACKTFQSHGPKTTCAHLLNDGKRICVGYGDGSLKLWDLKNANYMFHVSGNYAHKTSTTCIDVNENYTLLASGSEDGILKLTHLGNGKVLGSIEAALIQEGDLSIESVAFCSILPVVLTGSLSGKLGIWDLTNQRIRQQCEHPAGVTKILCEGGMIFSACLDGILRLWDARSGNCEREWHGHSAPILDMAYSRLDACVFTSSDDKTVKRYSLAEPCR